MLALTFLVALGLLAWRAWGDRQGDLERLALLDAEIKTLKASVWLDQPVLHQAILHAHEEFKPLQTMRKRSIQHFDLLQQKYSTMESKGADVLSIRGIPSLQVDQEPAPVIFRLLVPETRVFWLKFGVHQMQRTMYSSKNPEDDFELLTHSPFAASGPFEVRMPAGDQTLRIASGSAQEGSLPLVITLNDEVLLRTAFVSDDVIGTTSGNIAGPSQINYGPRQGLPPWLLTAKMRLRRPESGREPDMTHGFSVWVSDRSSGFTSFPGE